MLTAGPMGSDGGAFRALFEVAEIEGPIPNDGAAQCRAVLRLRDRNQRVGKRICGVEALVAKISIHIAMHHVRAALCHNIKVAAKSPAELRLASGGDDL